ncbi:unnamed protein product [Polarella glacialis]|uniref:DNA topoisomerase (ATP-hydrolyzing) n=1 Tax=Polarella glacialis TaxID=89957 RepID=A0A813GTS4_POLGL|nr:unnamed protein product [Polarella glacialis]
MGLDVKTQYDSTSKLRLVTVIHPQIQHILYGSIMLMTDQDHDGSHIKGLLINLIHFWWPSLAKMNGFLKEFITPIVKVWKESSNNGARREETSFFSMNQYEAWKAQQERKGFKSKYYKGLGTSTAKEAKEYFRDIEQHEIEFKWTGEQDGEAIDLAFNKKRADDRKDWINGYEDGTYVDHTRGSVGYTDFVHKELVQFAKYDVQRSVPSLVDGFKPSQRKVLFCAFKKKLRNDIKVAQFVGYISEQSAYHHGEVSLENTIVNLAQNFVGSNNTNLLVPSGQFGTRLQGGKDHAAARYIYTRLSPVTRILFHPDDDNVLQYLDDEGLVIEPKWYCPILPTVLMNGADGIGVGWSTNIPNYNPREIIRNLRMMLRGMPMAEMHPWYKGFQGSILPNDREPGKYEVTGVIRKRDGTTLEITELPVKNWTQNYKEFLEELMPKDGKKGEESSESTIEDFREYHTESSVHFVVTMTPEKMRAAERAGLEKTFKLKSSLATSNMVLFDAEGKITRYNTSLDILQEFCSLRQKMYVMRKAFLVAKLTRETEILSNKARFILMVVKGELELRRKKKADLLRELKQQGFTPMSQLDAIMKGKTSVGVPQDAEAGGGAAEASADDASDKTDKSEYDYLLGMNLWSLTFEKVEEIKKQLEVKVAELDVLQKTMVETLWDRDLEAVSVALDEMDKAEEEEALAGQNAKEGRKRKKGGGARWGMGGSDKALSASVTPSLVPTRKLPASREVFLDGSLVAGSASTSGKDLGEVQKTVWGVGGYTGGTANGSAWFFYNFQLSACWGVYRSPASSGTVAGNVLASLHPALAEPKPLRWFAMFCDAIKVDGFPLQAGTMASPLDFMDLTGIWGSRLTFWGCALLIKLEAMRTSLRTIWLSLISCSAAEDESEDSEDSEECESQDDQSNKREVEDVIGIPMPKGKVDLTNYMLPPTPHFFTFEAGSKRLQIRNALPACNPHLVRGLIFFLHGYGAHINRPMLHQWLQRLAAAGYAIFSFDFPGHGYSPGERAYVKKGQHFGSKLWGIVLLAPALKVDMPPEAVIYLIRHAVVPLMPSSIMPAFLSMSASVPISAIIRDEEMADKVQKDNWGEAKGGLGWRNGMRRVTINAFTLLMQSLPEVMSSSKGPMLVLHDPQDAIAHFGGSECLMELSPSTDKALIKMEDARHDIASNEPDTSASHVIEWRWWADVDERCNRTLHGLEILFGDLPVWISDLMVGSSKWGDTDPEAECQEPLVAKDERPRKEIYALVRSVPKGRVTTYGAVAQALGRGCARNIGTAMYVGCKRKNPYGCEAMP